MLKRSLTFALVLTPLLITGCGNLPFLGGGEANDPAATPPAQPVPAAPAQASDPAGGDAAFDDPLVESDQKPDDPEAAAGLIPLVSEEAAAKLAQSGRKDPFSTLAIDSEDILGGESVTTLLPKLPKLPAIPNLQVPAIGPFAPEPPPALPTNLPQGEVPFFPDLPPLPEPTIANELIVTGVITLKGVTHAIVEGPDLKSTYVREGDYIANGQVLVKRIEASKGGPALVVFEELGIEIVKGVGEGADELTSDA